MVLCSVMFLLRWENLTSTSFLGFRERCQYLTQTEKPESQWALDLNDFTTPCPMCLMFEYSIAYLHVDTGLGSTTPAVYTAWNIPSKFTLRVISLISTGATRFERSFLWTHRKLISTILFNLKRQKEKGENDLCITVKWFSSTHVAALCQMRMITYERSRLVDADICRDGTDEADELLIWGHSHSTMPLW